MYFTHYIPQSHKETGKYIWQNLIALYSKVYYLKNKPMSETIDVPYEWKKIPDIQDVLAVEQLVKSQINVMWGNDSEFWDIEAIVRKARDWTLNATTAILQMQRIMDSKQAYH